MLITWYARGVDYFQTEELFDCFAAGRVGLASGIQHGQPITRVNVYRNDDQHIRIELTSSGWIEEQLPIRQAGEVYRSTEELHFQHLDGSKSVAKGLVDYGIYGGAGDDGLLRSVRTYSAHSLEMDCGRPEPGAYTIEWVANLPHRWSWPSRTSRNENAIYTQTVGTGPTAITLTRSSRARGGASALHLSVDGIDLYLLSRQPHDDVHKGGQIIYKGCHPEETRKRIRSCLSFALGLPIVYYGHTDYCEDWQPTFMRAWDAMSIDGAMFKLHDLPPYPFDDTRMTDVVDEATLSQIVGSLYDR